MFSQMGYAAPSRWSLLSIVKVSQWFGHVQAVGQSVIIVFEIRHSRLPPATLHNQENP